MKRVPLILLMALSIRPVWGVQHIVPGAYPNAFQDMIHHPSAARIRAAGSLQAALTSGSTGSKNVAVIIVQFPAGESGITSGSRSIVNVTNIKNNFIAHAAYYAEVSQNHLALTYWFFNYDTATSTGDASPSSGGTGVYTMAHPMEYYGCGDEGQGSIAPCSSVSPAPPTTSANGNYLARDAIIAARSNGFNGGSIPGHTGLISKDNGGTFDAIIIIHAGNGNETTTTTPGDIWSIFYSQDPDIIGGQSTTDPQPQAVAAGFNEADIDPETENPVYVASPFGVMCHEFGHSLGLPDLYNTSAIGGASVVGNWELMDAGPYDGPAGQRGTDPAHMGAWDKQFLGWVTPALGTSKQNVSLTPIETSASMLKIPILTGLPQEYFLVEYRLRTSGATYDRDIPGDGLLIWHIDDAIMLSRGIGATIPGTQNTVNTGNPHYGASIIPQDGSTIGLNGGDAGNPFGNNENFTPPDSNAFSGVSSGISLVGISGVGGPTVTSAVTNIAATAGQNIIKLINYPNPAGKAYPHPSGAGHTTIQAQLTRPANDFSILIYTLSGDLVKKIGLSDVSLNINRSADDKWVYEYVWDLTNGDGAMVAPGVYLYLLRVDGSTQTNKAVIIR